MFNIKPGRPKSLLIVFFSFITLSSVLFSGLLYEKYQLAKAASFMTFFLILAFILLFSETKIKFNSVLFILLIFLYYIFSKILLSPYAIKTGYAFSLVSPAVFILPLFIKFSARKLLVLINILLFFSVAFGIYQFAGGSARPHSFFGNPIFFGEFILINFFLVLISFYYFKNKPLLVLNLFLAVLGVIFALSKGVFVSLLISFCVFAFLIFKSGNIKPGLIRPAVIIITGLFILLAAGFLLNPGQREAGTPLLKSQAVLQRALMAKASLEIARNNPVVGTGAGGIRYFYQKYQSEILNNNRNYNFVHTSYSHNDYVQLLAETGVTGLALFLIFLFMLASYFEKTSANLPREKNIFSIALFSGVLAVVIESFFNFPLFIFPSCLLFWLYAGMLYARLVSADNNLKQKKRAFSIIILILALLPVAITGALKYNDIISDFYLKHALERDAANMPDNEKYYEKATAFNPRNFYAYYYLGRSCSVSLKTKDAVAAYKNALDIYPFSADILFNIGNLYLFEKKYKKAEIYLGKSLALFPNFAGGRLRLGKALIGLGKDREAAGHIAFAVEKEPSTLTRDFKKNIIFFGEITVDKYGILH